MKSIAVLVTCHNRREKTLTCLTSLFGNNLQKDYVLETFLVDDGSTDGTTDEVRKKFPPVNIITGNGNLYWNGGMRLAWESASKTKDFDFYLWLNDDTLLDEFALKDLFNSYQEANSKTKNESIIVGACRESSDSENFSYGGRTENGPVIPNGKLQECKYINGNVVLVSKEIFKILGNLSPEYTHSIGDFDYGLRASKLGIRCYSTTKYVAVCPNNESAAWSNPNTPLKQRIKLLFSSKGLNLKEYIVFRKKFWGWRWIIFGVKAYVKTLFPYQYQWLNRNKK